MSLVQGEDLSFWLSNTDTAPEVSKAQPTVKEWVRWS